MNSAVKMVKFMSVGMCSVSLHQRRGLGGTGYRVLHPPSLGLSTGDLWKVYPQGNTKNLDQLSLGQLGHLPLKAFI